jgi:serum/glucocorticoid-regulated kinase 2
VKLHEAVGLSAALHEHLFKGYELDERNGNRSKPHLNFHRPYALVDYAHSQKSIEAVLGTTDNPHWIESAAFGIDVSRAAELAIYLYLRDPDAAKGSQDTLLGLVKFNPFDGTTPQEKQYLEIERGTGRLHVSMDWKPTEHQVFRGGLDPLQKLSMSKSVLHVRKKDTRQDYANRRIRKQEIFEVSKTAGRIDHPFIVQLAFSIETPRGIELYAPFVSGGNLFTHLQRVQRFDVDTCIFYAAEIVCAIEYVHDVLGVSCWLKSGNVHLDSVGHITLCGFGLFRIRDIEHQGCKAPEYPAPELLFDAKSTTKAADWWTLGIFLYEMFTGLPPFYSDRVEDIGHNILEGLPYFPESLPPPAKDLLAGLLLQDPDKRMGADGASQIKWHPFFRDIDWSILMQRTYGPTFKPSSIANHFVRNQYVYYGIEYPWEPRNHWAEQFGERSMHSSDSDVTSEDIYQHKPFVWNASSQISRNDEEWELIWNISTRAFHLFNRTTNVQEAVEGQDIRLDAIAAHASVENEVPDAPTQAQMHATLEAIMERGPTSAVAKLLDLGLDLKAHRFGIGNSGSQMTPLEWAVGHPNINVLRALVAQSAVKGSDRVAVTRALSLAVASQNVTYVEILLAHGVCCDFHESDRPLPHDPRNNGCYFDDPSDPDGFMPPLVRAIQCGNGEIARLLLEHGADPNVGYHNLSWSLHAMSQGGRQPIEFSCGRVAQLAMEMGHHHIVPLLFGAGADIGLAQPSWDVPGHECVSVPRPVYQMVTARLRAAKEGCP